MTPLTAYQVTNALYLANIPLSSQFSPHLAQPVSSILLSTPFSLETLSSLGFQAAPGLVSFHAVDSECWRVPGLGLWILLFFSTLTPWVTSPYYLMVLSAFYADGFHLYPSGLYVLLKLDSAASSNISTWMFIRHFSSCLRLSSWSSLKASSPPQLNGNFILPVV